MKDSNYVGLEDIKAYVNAGIDFKVIDNVTAADITAKELLEVVKREDTKTVSVDHVAILKAAIKSGSGFLAYTSTLPA